MSGKSVLTWGAVDLRDHALVHKGWRWVGELRADHRPAQCIFHLGAPFRADFGYNRFR